MAATLQCSHLWTASRHGWPLSTQEGDKEQGAGVRVDRRGGEHRIRLAMPREASALVTAMEASSAARTGAVLNVLFLRQQRHDPVTDCHGGMFPELHRAASATAKVTRRTRPPRPDTRPGPAEPAAAETMGKGSVSPPSGALEPPVGGRPSGGRCGLAG